MGIDYGLRRVGVAISDPTGTLATPVQTFTRRIGRRPPWAALTELAKTEGVEHLVVGLPLEVTGEENAWCAEVREFGDRLSERTGLDVSYVDERFSSIQAEDAVRSSGLPKKKREEKERIDAAAAAFILQSWLDGAEAR